LVKAYEEFLGKFMKNFPYIIALAILFTYTVVDKFSLNGEVAEATNLSSCNPTCGSCSVSVRGTWVFYTHGAQNAAVLGPLSLHLRQAGNRVTNSNSPVVEPTFVGTVFGNSINFSLTVAGDETHGYVNFCQGHVLGNKMFAICDDRDGARVSFTATR
jgi:hypothetical protein